LSIPFLIAPPLAPKRSYIKHNNNAGFVGGADMDPGSAANATPDQPPPFIRATPQAFSHFTFCHTKGRMMVVDIQGVDDL
jgi:hypothetical protein